MRFTRWLPAGMLACTMWACVAAQPPAAIVLEPAPLNRCAIGVAMTPIYAPADLEFPDSLADFLEAEVERHLRDLGFEVAPADVYAAGWEAAVRDAGGVYDPMTGERIEERYSEARRAWHGRLGADRGVSAVAFAEIETVDAEFTSRSGNAAWDGSVQGIDGLHKDAFTQFFDALDAIFGEGGGDDWEGTVPATSFVFVLESLDGVEWYVNRGGLEVQYAWKDEEWVTSSKRYTDLARYAQGVQTAMAPLLAECTPGGPLATDRR